MAGLQKIQKAVELLSMSQGAPKSMEEATKKRYRFWETQPVPEISKSIKHIITVGTDCQSILKLTFRTKRASIRGVNSDNALPALVSASLMSY